ncbi:hypothetical protein [Nonomuraea aurantiaca]|uniref:hypothetical protein n=1 Tax=Nonomuraea aurantiaca TaxID=2878562 RepID=UPI001CD99C41|nr:hypothetical protein [Nonomuraea aurantiaca]MCA2220045.1 hypothetical protein [Nonomuraea aurantiaca]
MTFTYEALPMRAVNTELHARDRANLGRTNGRADERADGRAGGRAGGRTIIEHRA